MRLTANCFSLNLKQEVAFYSFIFSFYMFGFHTSSTFRRQMKRLLTELTSFKKFLVKFQASTWINANIC